MQALPAIASGEAAPVPQPEQGVTYAAKLTKEEARIDWSRPAPEIDRLVHAFNPWPVAHTGLDGDKVRIWDSSVIDRASDASPGSVVSATAEGIDVATGAGLLRIERLQMPGKRPITAQEFLNANRADGMIFH